MANVYVRSGAGGAGTGADWANAYTTLAAAFTAKAAGDNFWISEDHAETQASTMTLTSPGTAAAPCTAICVNHSGTVPPVSADLRTTATITTTGASAINIGHSTYYYGITFSAGTGVTGVGITIGIDSGHFLYFLRCVLQKLGTNASGIGIAGAGDKVYVVFDNTQVTFGSTGDSVTVGPAKFIWKNTALPLLGGSTPNPVITTQTQGSCTLIGLDFSNSRYAAKTLIGISTTSLSPVLIENCAIYSGMQLYNTPGSPAQSDIIATLVDSSGTNYNAQKAQYAGTQTVETTIVRTGGAVNRTTPIAWKIVTTANSAWIAPFESLPISDWNDVVGSNVTVTVYGIWGGGAVPNTDDIWPVVSYMGSASSPIATITAGTKADFLAAGVAWASDGSTWGGSTTAFKMSVTITPALAGPVTVTIMAAKASSTFYIDPKFVLSS